MRESDAAVVVALVRHAFALQSAPVDPPASALRLSEADMLAHLRRGCEQVRRAGQRCGSAPPIAAGNRDNRLGQAATAEPLAGGAVAMTGHRLVGSVMWSERDGGLYVERLAVDPGHRGRGIARALMGAAEQAARAAGITLLHLGTRLALLDNRRLFAVYGFVETSLHAHPGFAEPTWVRMEKMLA